MIASASAISASALTFLACRYLSKRNEAKDNVYETEKLIGEYLIFHFGKPDELLPYGFGPNHCILIHPIFSKFLLDDFVIYGVKGFL